MVHRAVAYARLLHAADNALEGVQVLANVPVQLHVADMSGVGQSVEGGLLLYLLKGGDGVVHRHMEGVGVVVPVGDALYYAVLLLVYPCKGAGEPFGRGGKQRKVQAGLLRELIHTLAHICYNLKAQLIALLALPVVFAGKGHQSLRKADEAHGQCAVLQDLGHGVVAVQVVGVYPHPLAH